MSSFAQLQQELDAAWVNRTTSALYPPGMSYTNSLPLIAVEAGFDPVVLAVLQPSATPGGVALRKGIVREDLAGRLWYGAAATPVATTSFSAGYDPVQWVLDTFPPPAGVIGTDLDDYIADRRLTRQAMAFSLIAAADVPAYEAELQARLAAASAAVNLGEEDIGMIQVELTPPSGPMEILVRAPFWVDYLGVYETRDLMNPFPWTPLGTVPHTFDPMAWSYPLPGDLRYVILANHVRDTDGDGVLDALEKLVLGTDPDKWDTDGDGVGDYDEVFIHQSNPLAGGGTVGGPPDQVKYGLGLSDQDMSKVISGSAALRYKMRRVIRDKHGFSGFVEGTTTFLGYQSDFKLGQCGVDGFAQHVHYEGSYDLDYALPSLKYKVICPVAREGAGWNVPYEEVEMPNSAPMYMPAPGSPVAAGETRENTSGSVSSGNTSMSGSLSRSYGDSELLARASADFGSIQTNPLDWNHWLLLTRPLAGEPGGATPPNQDPTLALLDPIVGLTPPASRKHVHFDGPESPLMRAELQGIGVAAAVEPEVIPPGYLLRTIHLEVARKLPTEAFPAGEITRVTPREIFLKPGTPLAESMDFRIPPPPEEGTVEVVDGYVDLAITGLPEPDEESPGLISPIGSPIVISVGSLLEKLEYASYKLILSKPNGSQTTLRRANSVTPLGTSHIISEIEYSGMNEVLFEVVPDLIGEYRVEIETVASGRCVATLVVDQVKITAGLNITFVKHDDNWPIEDNKDSMGIWMPGRGQRMFVDAKTPFETGYRDTVLVKVSGILPGRSVVLKTFDVDDPTVDPGRKIDLNDPVDGAYVCGGDNEGESVLITNSESACAFFSNSGQLTREISCTANASGIAVLANGTMPMLKVTHYPGNNVRVAAVVLDSQNQYSSGSLTIDQLQVDDSRAVGYVPCGVDPVIPGFQGSISVMLTIWRQLSLEFDSMAGPTAAENTDTASIINILNVPDANQLCVVVDPAVSGKNNRLEYGLLESEAEKHAIISNEHVGIGFAESIDKIKIPNSITHSLALGGTCRIRDDDDTHISDVGLPSALPQNNLAGNYISGMRPVFNKAYIMLIDANASGLNARQIVPFRRNENPGWLSSYDDAKDLIDAPQFWAFTVCIGYQPSESLDVDPYLDENMLLGGGPKNVLCTHLGFAGVFVEVVREDPGNVFGFVPSNPTYFTAEAIKEQYRMKYYEAIAAVIAHEVGHGPGSQGEAVDHSEGEIMAGGGVTRLKDQSFSAKTIKRFRTTIQWTKQ